MAQQAVLEVSLKSYKAQIDALRASLLSLNKDSEEYKDTVKQIRSMQDNLNSALSAGKKDVDALDGSYNALSQQMSALKKEWKATNDEAKRNELGQQIEAINQQLKDLDASVGTYSRNVGDYAIAGESMKSQLREMQEQMANMIASGVDPASAKFQELAQRAGNMRDAMADAKGIVGQFADDTRGLSTALDVAKTGTAVFGAWKGAMSAFGIESEGAAKAIQKLQGVLTLLNSLQTIQTALVDKSSKTYQLWNKVVQMFTVSKTQEAVATNAATVANKTNTASIVAETTATNAATTATNAFKVALASTGIGLVVVAIGSLIAYLMNLKKSQDEATEAQERFAASLADSKTTLETYLSTIQSINNILQNFGKQTAIEGLRKEQEILAGQTEYLTAKWEALNAKFDDLDLAEATTAAAALTDIFKQQGKSIESQTQYLQRYAKAYAVTKEEIEEMKAGLEDMEEDEKALAQARINSMQLMVDEYDIMKQTVDLEGQISKAEEDEKKKKAEEAKKNAIDARRKAQEKAAKVAKEEMENLKRENTITEKATKYTNQLAVAKGKVAKEKMYLLSVEEINTEIKGLEKLKKKAEQFAKDIKLSEDQRKEYKKQAEDYGVQITEKTQERELTIVKANTEKIRDEYKRRYNAFKGVMSDIKEYTEDMLSEIEYQTNQAMLGIIPIDTVRDRMLELRNQVDTVTELIQNGVDPEKITIGFNFDALYKNVADAYYKVEEEVHRISEQFGEEGDLMVDVFAKYQDKILSQQENLYREWFKGEQKANTDLLSLEIMAEQEMFAQKQEYYINSLITIKQQLEEEKNLRIAERQKGNEADLELIRQSNERTLELEAEYNSIEQEATQTTVDFQIAQYERLREKREQDLKNQKDYASNVAKSTTTMFKSVGGLMDAVGDIMEQNIKRREEEGQISEEQAKAEFERVKKVQIAALWINTIAGAAGAFMQDMKSYPAPFNSIIAALDFATAMSLGIVQTRELKKQQYDSDTSGGSGSAPSIQQASVSPLLNPTTDVQTMTAMNTEDIANNTNSMDNRVYIRQTDIEDSQRQVAVRQSSTTF